MRYLVLLVLTLSALALAGGLSIASTPAANLRDCELSGGDGGNNVVRMSEGQYLMQVYDSDTWLCTTDTYPDAGCSDGGTCIKCLIDAGVPFLNKSMLLYQVGRGGKTVSCRSDGGTGDITFTKAD